jgi:translation initiation factor 3 subunit B
VRGWTAICALRSTSFHNRYKVRLEEGFDHILVVDGVPIIDKSKLERLLAKIAKEFTRKGAAIKPDDISVPWNEKTGKSNGYEPFPVPYILSL